MEEDLPLIEIAAEDDSLIQQSPSAVGTSESNCLFACSPFQILPSRPRSSHPSPTVRLKNKEDVAIPTSPCATIKSNKENINISKSELPKLSMEPQQMKRRKKGSAYNLQRSLAWDKAFSTDEGFLDALELSMLGGSHGDCGKEFLPSIGGSGRKFSGKSHNRVDSSDFPGTPKGLSNQKGCRSSLKSGCPRALAFSSLKRSANSSITKAESKESQFIKLPVSRMGAQALDKFNKSNLPSTSQTKLNQIGREDILKVTSSQSSSKTTRPITSKQTSASHSAYSSEKPPIQNPKRNKIEENMDGKLISASHLLPQQPSLAYRVNSRVDVSTVAHPPKVITKHEVFSEKVAVATTIPHTEVQSKKPSGLRMPSPSLSFFSQPKYSSSNSLSRGSAPLINAPRSCVPNSQKLNVLNVQYDTRLPHVPGKLQKKVENNLCSGNAEISESISVRMTTKLAKNSALAREEQVSSYSKSSEVTEEYESGERMIFCDTDFPERENSGKVDQTFIEKEMDLLKNDNRRFIEDESSDRLKQDGNNAMAVSSDSRGTTMIHLEADSIVPKKNCQVLDQDVNETIINCHHAEESQCSSSTVPHETICNSKPVGAAEVIKQDSVLIMHEDINTTHDADLWKIDPVCDDHVLLEDESLESLKYKRESSPKGDSILYESKRSESLGSNDRIMLEDKSSDTMKYDREFFLNRDPVPCESKRSETLGSSAPLHTNAEQAYEDVSGSHQLHDKCGVNCLDTCLSEVSELSQSDAITENGVVNQDDNAVVINVIEQLQVVSSLSNAEKAVCIQGGNRFIDSLARINRSPGTKALDRDSAGNRETISFPLCTLEGDGSEVDSVENTLCKGRKVQSFDRSNSSLIDPATNILSSVVYADTNAESGQPPHVTDHICSENPDTSFDDCISLSEGTGGENQEGKCPLSTSTVQDQTDTNQVYIPKDGSDVYLEDTCERKNMYDEPSGSGTEASIENDNHSPDTVSKSDVVVSGEAMSTGQSCSGEIVYAVDTGIDKIKSASPDDIELDKGQVKENLVIEYEHGQDNASYPTEDAKTTLSIKTPWDEGIVGNLSIKPPPNAIPFSEEWLAAMEAAGEEILTMKSGAVQNSPTDKALPEPNPWSPVKRKQNQIGPYDCTKYMNLPPNSD